MALTFTDKINEKIYDVFFKNDVLFLSDGHDLSSGSIYTMMIIFDVFYYSKGYLWYRIKEKYNGCIIDKKKRLKKRCYLNRIYVIQLFDNDVSLESIKTEDYVDEDEFYKYRDRGELDQLLYDEFESDISLSGSCSSLLTSEEDYE